MFAKNSDRPPGEAQDLAWHPPRRDCGPLRVTDVEIEPYRADTLGCVLSRPLWCWGAEHGVTTAGVAAGNATIYTTLDRRPFPDALTGMDLVRLAWSARLRQRWPFRSKCSGMKGTLPPFQRSILLKPFVSLHSKARNSCA